MYGSGHPGDSRDDGSSPRVVGYVAYGDTPGRCHSYVLQKTTEITTKSNLSNQLREGSSSSE